MPDNPIWSCDDRGPRGECRNPHGCHCDEIAGLVAQVEQLERTCMARLPMKPLPEDAVDLAAHAITAEVAHHIKTMYPAAAQAVAWGSCKRSLAGVIRNGMRRLGDAAERGEMEAEIRAMRSQRAREDEGPAPTLST
ncbi:hypothetical protein HLH33_17250 [Gluconacetobacter diazotrophicus]|uniref:Uncharacterized protein n=1 Tax=Gluconacetobacter diazotrophicus TaxID=33996 RepID=A0A7W4I823_GLUDI|nr:hypothetical protein [Gluconacetobacter diazotrophicus]MBB2158019.1 hypothetical protein [Gluconacetobacter diazotrophicus]